MPKTSLGNYFGIRSDGSLSKPDACCRKLCPINLVDHGTDLLLVDAPAQHLFKPLPELFSEAVRAAARESGSMALGAILLRGYRALSGPVARCTGVASHEVATYDLIRRLN